MRRSAMEYRHLGGRAAVMTGEACPVILYLPVGNAVNRMLSVLPLGRDIVFQVMGEFGHIDRVVDYGHVALLAGELGGVLSRAAVIAGVDASPGRTGIDMTGGAVAGDGVRLQMVQGPLVIVTAAAVHIRTVYPLAAGNYGGYCRRVELGAGVGMAGPAIVGM